MEKTKIIRKASEILVKIYAEYPEYGEIEKIIAYIKGKTLTPDELSRAILKMGILLVRIGQLSAELSSNANEAYVYRKQQYLWEFTQLSVILPKTVRENEATEKIFAKQEDELIKRFVADHVGAFYKDAARLCMLVQSRLKVLENERINMNKQT